MGETFINIQFPFRDDDKGKFLEMNKTTKKAIKADLMHLLMTNRGERLYLPAFGTNLRKYIFEQNDFEVHTGIKNEIQGDPKKEWTHQNVNKRRKNHWSNTKIAVI